MADTVDLDIRSDISSTAVFRVECLYCGRLTDTVPSEREAHIAVQKHIDYWPGHEALIFPVTLVSRIRQ